MTFLVLYGCYLLLPALGVVVLGGVWTWHLAYGRPSRRRALAATVVALLLGPIYSAPLGGFAWWTYEQQYLPFRLVVPDGYTGHLLVVACRDAGEEPAWQVHVPASGVVEVRIDPDELTLRSYARAHTEGGAPLETALQAAMVDGGCGYFDVAVAPEGGDPWAIPYPTDDPNVRLERARAEGRTFAEVSRP